MSDHLIFKQNSRLFQSGSRYETQADWLINLISGNGISRVPPNSDALKQALSEKQDSLVLWDAGNQAELFSDFLAQKLNFPDARTEYLPHYLNQWSQSGGILWVWVRGDGLSAQQLNSLLDFAPLTDKGSYALRIVLELDADRLNTEKSLSPLRKALQQRDTRIHHGPAGDAKRYTKPLVSLVSVLSVVGIVSVADYWVSNKKDEAPLFNTQISQPVIKEAQGLASQQQERQVQPLQLPQNQPKLELQSKAQEQEEVRQPAALPVTSELSEDENLATVDHLVGEQVVEQEVEAGEFSETATADLKELIEKPETEEVEQFVKSWLTYWSDQNIGQYLLAYDDSYTLNKSMTPSEWRIWRTTRLKKPLWIRIEPGPITVTEVESGYLVSFWQLYRSPGYQDNTLKELEIMRTDQGLKIVRETNKEVRLVQD